MNRLSPITARLLVAVTVVMLALAALATFVPASAQGAECGTWVAPAYDEEELQALLKRGAEASDAIGGFGSEGADMAAGLDAQARNLVLAFRLCSDSLSTRRTTAIALAAVGVLGPVIALFVLGGVPTRRRRSAESSS